MKKHNDISGFTLIELAVVIVIVAIMTALALQSLNLYTKYQATRVTRERLEAIDKQLTLYLEENGRLPCVAARNAALSSNTFGVSIGNVSGCQGGASEPAYSRPTVGGRNIYVGVVPVRTLNLPDSFMFDGWENRIQYAVTSDQARIQTVSGGQQGFRTGQGGISVQDSNGNSIFAAPNTGDYVLFSSGFNKYGAVTKQGRVSSCPSTTGRNDQENCDRDGNFIASSLIRDVRNANRLDDTVIARRLMGYNILVPSDAVIPVNTPSCPTGWQQVTSIPPSGSIIYCQRL